MSSSARIGQQIWTNPATSNSLSRCFTASWALRSARIHTLVSIRRGPRSTAGIHMTAARAEFGFGGFKYACAYSVRQCLAMFQLHKFFQRLDNSRAIGSRARQTPGFRQKGVIERHGQSFSSTSHRHHNIAFVVLFQRLLLPRTPPNFFSPPRPQPSCSRLQSPTALAPPSTLTSTSLATASNILLPTCHSPILSPSTLTSTSTFLSCLQPPTALAPPSTLASTSTFPDRPCQKSILRCRKRTNRLSFPQLVTLVYLVCLVHLVSLVRSSPNQTKSTK